MVRTWRYKKNDNDSCNNDRSTAIAESETPTDNTDNNQHITELVDDNNIIPPTTVPLQTASESKIAEIEPSSSSSVSSPLISGYRLMDMSILAEVFTLLSCPGCKGVQCLQLSDINEQKKGLARYLEINCTFCLFSYNFYTSKQIDSLTPRKNKGGQKLFDVNVRAVYGCRQIGSGHEHLKKLCWYWNMPEPIRSDNFYNITLKLK